MQLRDPGEGTRTRLQALIALMRYRKAAMTYGVTVQTLDRPEGNGVTVVFVDAEDALHAEREAGRIAEHRFGCSVLVNHAVPWA
jgi:hypothetical protein